MNALDLFSFFFNADAYKSGNVAAMEKVNGVWRGVDLPFSRGSSGTRINKSGILTTETTNIPRIDFMGGGCPALLFERTSQELTLHTSDLSNAVWNKAGVNTYTYNASVAPDGTTTADRVTVNAGSITGNQATFQAQNVVSGTKYTASWLVKPAGYNWFIFQIINGSFNGLVWFNATTLQVGTQSGSAFEIVGIEQGYANGFNRFYLTFTAALTGVCEIAHYGTNANGALNFTATGGLGFDLWGANLAAGVLSSHVPATSSTVTRSSDTNSGIAIDNYLTSGEGSFFIELRDYVSDSIDTGIYLQGASTEQINIDTDGVNNRAVVRVGSESTSAYATKQFLISFDSASTMVYQGGALVATLGGIANPVEDLIIDAIGVTAIKRFGFSPYKITGSLAQQISQI